MYSPDVYKQAKELVAIIAVSFLVGRLYEKIKIAKMAMKNSEGDT